MNIEPIAYIKTDFCDKFGIPRQSGRVENTAVIEFVQKYRDADALRCLDEFSHIWLLFDFSLSHRDTFSATVRPPRLGGNRRVGVFASRSPYRPNSIGMSAVKLIGINDDLTLSVGGCDLLDNTPIYDIKPYLPSADKIDDASGGWADEQANHKLNVVFPDELLALLPEDKRATAVGLIADDPRPSYQNDERTYKMRFCGYDISFVVNDDTANVIKMVEI